jgi:hypothetical protein
MPYARQHPLNEQLYNNAYWVTALQTNMFVLQQEDTAKEDMFYVACSETL